MDGEWTKTHPPPIGQDEGYPLMLRTLGLGRSQGGIITMVIGTALIETEWRIIIFDHGCMSLIIVLVEDTWDLLALCTLV